MRKRSLSHLPSTTIKHVELVRNFSALFVLGEGCWVRKERRWSRIVHESQFQRGIESFVLNQALSCQVGITLEDLVPTISLVRLVQRVVHKWVVLIHHFESHRGAVANESNSKLLWSGRNELVVPVISRPRGTHLYLTLCLALWVFLSHLVGLLEVLGQFQKCWLPHTCQHVLVFKGCQFLHHLVLVSTLQPLHLVLYMTSHEIFGECQSHVEFLCQGAVTFLVQMNCRSVRKLLSRCHDQLVCHI